MNRYLLDYANPTASSLELAVSCIADQFERACATVSEGFSRDVSLVLAEIVAFLIDSLELTGCVITFEAMDFEDERTLAHLHRHSKNDFTIGISESTIRDLGLSLYLRAKLQTVLQRLETEEAAVVLARTQEQYVILAKRFIELISSLAHELTHINQAIYLPEQFVETQVKNITLSVTRQLLTSSADEIKTLLQSLDFDLGARLESYEEDYFMDKGEIASREAGHNLALILLHILQVKSAPNWYWQLVYDGCLLKVAEA